MQSSKAFDTRGVLSTPASDVHERLKTLTPKRLKLQERLLTINKRNIIRWNIYRTTIFIREDRYQSVSKNPESLCIKLKFMFWAGFPGVCCFERWTRGEKIAQSFLSAAKIITKYSSQRFFLSVCGEKIRTKRFFKFYKLKWLKSNLILWVRSLSN